MKRTKLELKAGPWSLYINGCQLWNCVLVVGTDWRVLRGREKKAWKKRIWKRKLGPAQKIILKTLAISFHDFLFSDLFTFSFKRYINWISINLSFGHWKQIPASTKSVQQPCSKLLKEENRKYNILNKFRCVVGKTDTLNFLWIINGT